MYDVIVIGVGTMGAAACDWLTRRGPSVLGLEQFTIPHDRGAHHGLSRMFRMAYYEHPDYVPLLKRAYEQWKELERGSGETLFHEVGGLYMGTRDGELLRGSIESARRHAVPHRELSHADLVREFPQFVLPREYVGLLESKAGFIVPEAAVRVMADAAAGRGAEILQRQRVTGWSARGGVVTVRTVHAEYEARSLVITAGAWASSLIAGVDVVVTRQVLGWVRVRDPEMFRAGARAGGFPCWGIGNEDGSLAYGFPLMAGETDLKMALHAKGVVADPDQLDRLVTAADEAEFRAVIAGHMPEAEGATVRTAVCMYANSPDSHFIIDRHPEHANVVIACGFSGHGFKFAPVIGEVLADLALNGRTELPVGFLGLGRFRK